MVPDKPLAGIDGVEDLWERRFTAFEVFILVLVTAGITVTVSALLEPQMLLVLFLDHVPGLVMAMITWLGVHPKTAVALYGGFLTVGSLGVFAVVERRARAGVPSYRELREPVLLRFLVAISFFVGFVGARTVVIVGGLALAGGGGGLMSAGLWIFGDLLGHFRLFGYHIHHFFYGFVLLVIAGWGALLRPDWSRRHLAVVYGLGVGIFVDEFGFLLTWGDYWARQSLFAAVIYLNVLFIGILWVWGTRETEPSEAGDAAVPSAPDEGGQS